MRAPARVITAVALGALLMVSASSSALGRSPQSFGPGVDFSSAQVSAIRIGNTTDANGGLGAARLLGFTARWLHQ